MQWEESPQLLTGPQEGRPQALKSLLDGCGLHFLRHSGNTGPGLWCVALFWLFGETSCGHTSWHDATGDTLSLFLGPKT